MGGGSSRWTPAATVRLRPAVSHGPCPVVFEIEFEGVLMPHWWLPEIPVGEKILRSLICCLFLLVMFRLLGKREVGRMTPFDLIVLLVLLEPSGKLGVLKQEDSPNATSTDTEQTPDRSI
jgi:hypothetical protein